jgi:hypothetical protein
MRNLIVIAITSLFVANTAFAASCADQAAEKKLAGAAKNSFMTKCEKDTPAAAPAPSACDAKAAEKKLAGAAKAAFIKKCEKDAGAPAAAPSCEAQAVSKDGKPLAGAAKAASIKKCEADAKK